MMTPEQQHHIRNAVMCLRRAIQIRDWSIVEEQTARIDRAIRPESCRGEGWADTVTCVLLELRLVYAELERVKQRVMDMEQSLRDLDG